MRIVSSEIASRTAQKVGQISPHASKRFADMLKGSDPRISFAILQNGLADFVNSSFSRPQIEKMVAQFGHGAQFVSRILLALPKASRHVVLKKLWPKQTGWLIDAIDKCVADAASPPPPPPIDQGLPVAAADAPPLADVAAVDAPPLADVAAADAPPVVGHPCEVIDVEDDDAPPGEVIDVDDGDAPPGEVIDVDDGDAPPVDDHPGEIIDVDDGDAPPVIDVEDDAHPGEVIDVEE
jgi:hypothetical protein